MTRNCNTCVNEGYTEAEGVKKLCRVCTILCPNCDARGYFLLDDGEGEMNKEPCEFCYGDRYLPRPFVARYEDALGPYKSLGDADMDLKLLDELDERLREKFQRTVSPKEEM